MGEDIAILLHIKLHDRRARSFPGPVMGQSALRSSSEFPRSRSEEPEILCRGEGPIQCFPSLGGRPILLTRDKPSRPALPRKFPRQIPPPIRSRRPRYSVTGMVR
jgi:hypothetical protein